MNLADRTKSTLALVLGCVAITIFTPSCGDDDTVDGAGGMGSGGKSGSAGSATGGKSGSTGKAGNGGGGKAGSGTAGEGDAGEPAVGGGPAGGSGGSGGNAVGGTGGKAGSGGTAAGTGGTAAGTGGTTGGTGGAGGKAGSGGVGGTAAGAGGTTAAGTGGTGGKGGTGGTGGSAAGAGGTAAGTGGTAGTTGGGGTGGSAAGTGGTGGSGGSGGAPSTFTAIATFDTTVQGWTQKFPPSGVITSTVSFASDADSEGAANSGSVLATIPFTTTTAGTTPATEVLFGLDYGAAPVNLAGRTLSARVRVDSGDNASIKLVVKSAPGYTYASGTPFNVAPGTTWVTVTFPSTSFPLGYNAASIVEIDVAVTNTSASATCAAGCPVTVHIDTVGYL